MPHTHNRSTTRPQRFEAVKAEIHNLREEYERWLEGLPESLQDTTLAELLQETIDQLDEASDLLHDIELPKGFGRD